MARRQVPRDGTQTAGPRCSPRNSRALASTQVVRTMTVTETLAQITGPDFVAGIVLWNNYVVEAAPKLKFMRRWSRDKVRDYCRSRMWSAIVVHELQRSKL